MSLIPPWQERPLQLSEGDRRRLLQHGLGGMLVSALLLLPLRWWLLEQPVGGLAWELWWGDLVVLLGLLLGLLAYLRRWVELPLAQLLRGLPREAAPRIDLVPEDGIAPLRLLSLRINRLLEQINSNAIARAALLRGLVHDLRGPLSRLILRVEQLRLEREVDPDMIRGLQGDLEALRNLSDQLATLAEDEPLQNRAVVLALDDLCHRIADSYGPGRVEVRTPRLLVRLDRASLQRTLNNLIDNALEYGQPPVQISARLAGQALMILVENHGQGMPSSGLLSMVHSPRDDDRQHSQHQGLGLSIAQHFCRRHGGVLHLGQSSLGGLAVELRLPLAVLVTSTNRCRQRRDPSPFQAPDPSSAG
ncbi:MAG: HAMP domain-containing sensor histidine kinase [Cyanobium sp.]